MHSSLPLKRKETSHRCRSPPVPGDGFQVRELQYFEGNKPKSSKLSPVILGVNAMNKGKNPLIWTKSPTSPLQQQGSATDLISSSSVFLTSHLSYRPAWTDASTWNQLGNVAYLLPASLPFIAYLHLEEWPQCAHGETGNFQGQVPQFAPKVKLAKMICTWNSHPWDTRSLQNCRFSDIHSLLGYEPISTIQRKS